VIDGSFALAFTAGMVATVNPCGFAMLPAYLSYFLGLGKATGEGEPPAASLNRALVVSAAVSMGFIVVFTVLGIAVNAGTEKIVEYAKYATIFIGVLLIGVGIAMLAGWRLPLSTPKLERGGRDRTLTSMFVFGVSYAIASLGCTVAPFIAIVLSGFTRDGFVSGVLSIVMYGVGMALVLTALTVTLALARGGLLKVLRSAMTYVDRFAGIFLILAGAYLVYYWIFNLSTDNGLSSDTGGGVAKTVEGWSADIANWIQQQSVWRLGGLLALVVIAASIVALGQRRRSSRVL
jgi:cytochrome c-type biogenesis protein